jgi:hypothetical protein
VFFFLFFKNFWRKILITWHRYFCRLIIFIYLWCFKKKIKKNTRIWVILIWKKPHLYQVFYFRVTKTCQSLKKIKKYFQPIAEFDNFTSETVLSIKKWEHPEFLWYGATCLIKDKKKIKTSQSQTFGGWFDMESLFCIVSLVFFIPC